MKVKGIILAVVLVASAVSCGKPSVSQTGSIMIDIEAALTKAGADDIDTGTFNVCISGVTYHKGEEWSRTLKYSQFQDNIQVPYGVYDISAESCTGTEAEVGDGNVRYAGVRKALDVYSANPRHAKIICTIANAAVKVVFDESFREVFDEGSVVVSDGVREFEISIAQSEERIVWYNVGDGDKTLTYLVKGIIDGVGKQYEGSLTLSAAQQGIITVKSGKDGFFAPHISVDDVYEDNDIVEIIDPQKQ